MLPEHSLLKCKYADFLVFNNKDLISNNLRKNGVFEEDLLLLSTLFYQDVDAPLIVDVGANIGTYAIPIAKDLAPKKGCVYAFEPQRIIFYQLCSNTIINKLDNLYLFNSAIGETDSEINIYESNTSTNWNSGAYSIEKQFREIEGIESSISDSYLSIPVKTLDGIDFPSKVTLLKIDVEGYELKVLKGSLNFLKDHAYPPIIFEAWSTDWFIEQKELLFGFLKSLGYKIQKINQTNYLAQHVESNVYVSLKIDANGNLLASREK